MWASNEVCRFAAAVVVGLLAAVLLRGHRRDPSALASVFLLVSAASHLVFPLLLRRGAATPILHAVLLLAMAAPVAFWLLAQVHFDDDFRVRPVHMVAAAAFLATGYVVWLLFVERRFPHAIFPPEQNRFWTLLPRLLALAIVLHALLRVYVGAGTDLVLPRLRARFLLLTISGTYILLELFGEVLFTGSESEALADGVHSLAVLALVLGVAFFSLRIAPEVLRAPRAAFDGPTLDPALAEQLQRLVDVDEVWRQEGLTIGDLAERLGAQEYKVRQLINAQLGFKNFNGFLNRYRIAAAEKVLADPSSGHLGVAQIAYQVGYRSLGTFNRAFKDATGRTPSEARAFRRP
jgi:AraC-like DNA-binding protein